jgi:hypothetical protein
MLITPISFQVLHPNQRKLAHSTVSVGHATSLHTLLVIYTKKFTVPARLIGGIQNYYSHVYILYLLPPQ